MAPWIFLNSSCHPLLLEMLQNCCGHGPASSFTTLLLRSATVCWLSWYSNLWRSLGGKKIKVTLKPQTMYKMYHGLYNLLGFFFSFLFFFCLIQLEAEVSRRDCCLHLKLLCRKTPIFNSYVGHNTIGLSLAGPGRLVLQVTQVGTEGWTSSSRSHLGGDRAGQGQRRD